MADFLRPNCIAAPVQWRALQGHLRMGRFLCSGRPTLQAPAPPIGLGERGSNRKHRISSHAHNRIGQARPHPHPYPPHLQALPAPPPLHRPGSRLPFVLRLEGCSMKSIREAMSTLWRRAEKSLTVKELDNLATATEEAAMMAQNLATTCDHLGALVSEDDGERGGLVKRSSKPRCPAVGHRRPGGHNRRAGDAGQRRPRTLEQRAGLDD